MAENIFLSYRRDDSRGYTNAIYTLLELHFPPGSIFMDVDTLVPGSDFVQSLQDAVENCDIFLAVIGSRWVNIQDQDGKRRLDNPEDFVRIEIAHALSRGIPVIPVLVDGAKMPSSDDLPDNLKELAKRHAFSIGDHMRSDVQRLIKVLEETFERLEKERLEREKKEAELITSVQIKKGRKEQEIAGKDRRVNQQVEVGGRERRRGSLSLPLIKRIPVWVWIAAGVLLVLAGYGLYGGFSPSQPMAPVTAETLQNEIAASSLTSTPAVTNTLTPSPTVTPPATLTPVALSTPELGIGSTQISPVDGMVQVFIPAGEFLMGSETGESNAQPVHEVYLDGFWMDENEVTAEQFQNFLEVTNYTAVLENSGDFPAAGMEWEDAASYCEWAGRRLPTEAEWEKAARGGLEGMVYPWGNTDYNNLPGMIDGVQGGSAVSEPINVKTYGANDYGLYDMAGNVWEWTADYYDEDYYSNSPRENPTGPETGIPKVIRGGSYFLWMNNLRVDHRFWSYEGGPHIGFRCVTPLEP